MRIENWCIQKADYAQITSFIPSNASFPILFSPFFCFFFSALLRSEFLTATDIIANVVKGLQNSSIGTVIWSLLRMSRFNVLNDVEKWVWIPRIIWQKEKHEWKHRNNRCKFPSSVRYWPDFYCLDVILRIAKIIRPWFILPTHIVWTVLNFHII